MVSLFGRTVIAKTMTFYPSTTLATTLQRASFGAVHPGLGNGMSFERERVDSCENAVGTVTESVGSEGACRGVAIGVAWCPLVARGGARAQGSECYLATWLIASFAIVRVLHMHPTRYN